LSEAAALMILIISGAHSINIFVSFCMYFSLCKVRTNYIATLPVTATGRGGLLDQEPFGQQQSQHCRDDVQGVITAGE